MSQEKGNLSINSENFLPIIKKWLYTDKDIFVRELVSNGCDAVSKLKKLMSLGEADNVPADEEFEINIVVNKDLSTITISDNGIGMTADEVKKYIAQIAFSGAADFLAKYEGGTDAHRSSDSGKENDRENEIIGHFGLGFYSAFMVADKIEIDTLSYLESAEPARWVCQGGVDYEMEKGSRQNHGTDIILYVGEDGKDFLDESVLYGALRKYCSFMPVPIYVDFVTDEKEENKESKEADDQQNDSNIIHISPEQATDIESIVKENQEGKESNEADESESARTPLNDVNPLWLHQPKDCTDEQYKEFYHKVFTDINEPLFWIHLNMDYPFRLKGILYFPKLENDMDAMDGAIKLYCNQVYIADNIKEVVPEFLLLLKGVIDCPDLPLNVSRSALQNDGYVQKMSSYITKKVADKLNKLFKNERENYEKFFDDISVFIKYGCMKEENLYDKIKDSILFKTTEGAHKTIDEYSEANKDKNDNKIFYVTDENQQVQYINLFKAQEMEAFILTAPIDKPFVSFLEYKNSGKYVFSRIDSDIASGLTEKDEKQDDDKAIDDEMTALFNGFLNKKKFKVRTESLKAKDISGMIILDETSRRIQDMAEQYRQRPEMQDILKDIQINETLVLNKNNTLVQKVMAMKGDESKADTVKLICEQIYDIALLGQKTLSPEEMTSFIARSNAVLELLAEK